MSAGFAAAVHAARRDALVERLGDEAVAVLPAAREVARHRDVTFEFRQDSDFAYLTGFPEPDAVAVVTGRDPDHRFVLFVRPRDPERERWDGPRAGIAGAVEEYGADAAYPLERAAEVLPRYLAGSRRLVAPFGRDRAFDELLAAARLPFAAHPGRERPGPALLEDPEAVVGELRLRKRPEEVERLRRAAALAAAGHRAALRAAAPGRHEYEVQAALEAAFRAGGARGVAFTSIVASGPNACVLHYTANRRRLGSGDLVLVDAGPDLDGYVSDVTRTFPADGRFTAPQRAVYDVVLAAQRAVLAAVRPGTPWDRLQEVAVRALAAGLVDLGLVAGGVDEVVETGAYRPFYMHSVGHWVGLDLRDAGRYRDGAGWRPLEAGMTFTVEPGLYVPPDAAAGELAGLGVRIEDVVLVTADGCEVLSSGVPTAPDEVAAAVGG